jgi:hypothetical protein
MAGVAPAYINDGSNAARCRHPRGQPADYRQQQGGKRNAEFD